MKKQNVSHWQIDKRIPLAIIFTLMMQLFGALFWAAQLDARVMRMEQQSMSQRHLNERFARLEERLDNVKADTDSMKQLLANMAEKLFRR